MCRNSEPWNDDEERAVSDWWSEGCPNVEERGYLLPGDAAAVPGVLDLREAAARPKGGDAWV